MKEMIKVVLLSFRKELGESYSEVCSCKAMVACVSVERAHS